MISRQWRGLAHANQAENYIRHLRAETFPAVRKLPGFVDASGRGRLPDWKSYTFQYQGRRTMLGRKYVYINAFCDDPRHHSLTQWVEVFDGGACSFRAKYDPESKQVYDVEVNGVA